MSAKYVTPASELSYLHIFKPNMKFVPSGTWSVTAKMNNDPQWDKLIEAMTIEFNQYYSMVCQANGGKKLKKCPHFPWRETNGVKLFVAKNNVQGQTKTGETFTTKVKVFNPKMELIGPETFKGSLGNGTVGRIGFVTHCWNNPAQGVGLSARLDFVQITQPKLYDPTASFLTADGSTLQPDNNFNPELWADLIAGKPTITPHFADSISESMEVENILDNGQEVDV